MGDERERLDWTGFGAASRSLAVSIHDDGFEPDIILAIARGGLLVAGALGYALSVKNLYTMNVEYYTGVDQRLEVPMILPPVPDPSFLANADVLIADDVADTGHTLAAVKGFCTGKVAEVRVAVLFEKPRSVVKCEYAWKATDRWVEFPWSDQPPVSSGKTGRVVPER
jgi:hypoxanthine phosphoribosyltransferase